PGATPHARRWPRALRLRAGYLPGKRDDGPAAGHGACRVHRGPLSRRHFVPRPTVGRSSPARTGVRLRARDASPPRSIVADAMLEDPAPMTDGDADLEFSPQAMRRMGEDVVKRVVDHLATIGEQP